jgi:hypothetical protein
MINSPRANLRLALAATAVGLLFTGCGLAETTAVAASEAESSAEQAKQGKELEAKVQRDIDAAEKAAADARAKAEEAETQ